MPSMIESPSSRMPKRPKDGISREQKVAAVEKCFRGCLWRFRNICEYIGGRSWLGGHRGAHKVGGRALPPGRALHPCGCLVALLTCTLCLLGVFWSKKNHREGFILFGLRLVFVFCEAQKQGKNRNWHWALG